MEANKENVPRTKIPLPLEPLPALPNYLLKDNKTVNVKKQQRCALKTMNSQSMTKAGPSKVKVRLDKSRSLKVDTKHVTIRQRSEDLDWNYTIFKDNEVDKDASIISISDDETYYEQIRYYFTEKKNNISGATSSAVTPLKVCLESKSVRNLKRSLKRPHSRELQGLSPLAQNEKPDDKVKRRLQFKDRENDLGTPDYWKHLYVKCLNRDYTNDVFDYLLAVEARPLAVPTTSSFIRACVINWLMKVNGPNGNPATIQSACWYLDSILGTGHVEVDKLQLVAAACFWLAQKLQGPVAPALKLVKCSDRAFTAESLLAAEKAIVLRLQYPRQPIVAQEFITYLSWWCDHNHPGEIETAATFLCMSGMMVEKGLCEEYPSVIAAAAVKNALILLEKKDLVGRLHICPVFKSAAHKAINLSYTCSILRRAVRTVAAPTYEFKVPLHHYGISPKCIAQRIVNAANHFTLIDVRNTDRGRYSIQPACQNLNME